MFDRRCMMEKSEIMLAIIFADYKNTKGKNNLGIIHFSEDAECMA